MEEKESPNQEDPNDLSSSTYTTGHFFGSLVVDGLIFQNVFTWWASWIIMNLTGRDIKEALWWLGITILVMTLRWVGVKPASDFLVAQVRIFLLLTFWIWIFN